MTKVWQNDDITHLAYTNRYFPTLCLSTQYMLLTREREGCIELKLGRNIRHIAGFSLSRALCEPVPNIRIARLNSHDMQEWRGLTIVQVSKRGCVSITSWQHLTFDDASAPHRIVFFLLLFQLFPACRYVAKIYPSSWVPFCEAPVRPNVLNMPKSASV